MKNFFKSKLKFQPEITHGVCPTCDEDTLLVSLTQQYYRCITCGTDLEQKVNGVISYLPIGSSTLSTKTDLKNGS